MPGARPRGPRRGSGASNPSRTMRAAQGRSGSVARPRPRAGRSRARRCSSAHPSRTPLGHEGRSGRRGIMDDRPDRQPLPSEDTGDLYDEPSGGVTDDYLVAREEGVPYIPPTDRVMSEARGAEGVDFAGTDELKADVIEALRSSDVLAGDRIRIAVTG